MAGPFRPSGDIEPALSRSAFSLRASTAAAVSWVQRGRSIYCSEMGVFTACPRGDVSGLSSFCHLNRVGEHSLFGLCSRVVFCRVSRHFGGEAAGSWPGFSPNVRAEKGVGAVQNVDTIFTRSLRFSIFYRVFRLPVSLPCQNSFFCNSGYIYIPIIDLLVTIAGHCATHGRRYYLLTGGVGFLVFHVWWLGLRSSGKSLWRRLAAVFATASELEVLIIAVVPLVEGILRSTK